MKKWLLVVLLPLLLSGGLLRGVTAQAPDQPPFGTVDVMRVYFDPAAGPTHLLAATEGNLDVWEVDHAAGYLVALLSEEQTAALRSMGFTVEQDAVRSAGMRASQTQVARAASAAPAEGIPGYPCYRTVEETYGDLSTLAAEHPQLARWVDVGDSWDRVTPDGPSGYHLRVLILTNTQSPATKARFFLVGAIHARELTTAETATRFAEALVHGYGTDPEITWLLDHTEIHVMPVANPDGRKWAEQGYYWRKNTNTSDGCDMPISGQPKFPDYGVDLNRNSSFKWNECEGTGCSSGSACSITYRGSAPASEPETQAVQQYMASLYPDRRGEADADAAPPDTSGLFITLHSYGELVLFPWGWTNTPSANDAPLETLGRKFGYFTGYDVCQAGQDGCIYQTDGTTDDWAYGELGVAAYTFELGTSFFESCGYYENTIVGEMMPALLYAAKAARRPYTTPAGPEVLNVTASAQRITAGTPVTLTALADDTRYNSNGWGNEPTQVITAARYSVDQPAWVSGTALLPMVATDGAWDTVTETVQSRVETGDWAVGRHTVFVEAQDGAGNWGVPSALFVDVVEATHGVAVAPARATASGHPAESITHTLTLTNTGTDAETYGLTAESGWPVTLPGQVGPVAAGASTAVGLGVTIPPTATLGMTSTTVVSITLPGQPQALTTVHLTTGVVSRTTFLPWTPNVNVNDGRRESH